MTDAATFLAAILADPGDDLVRLVFADWLREQPDPGRVAAGRFLWAGVTAARYRGAPGPIEDDDYWLAVREMGEVERRAVPDALRAAGLRVDDGWVSEAVADRVTVRYRDGQRAVFERGLVAGLRVGLGEWVAVADPVLARCPLGWVEVADVPGLTVRYEPGSDPGRWSCTVRLAPTGRPAPWGPAQSPVVERRAEYPDRAALVARSRADAWGMVYDVRREARGRWPGAEPSVLLGGADPPDGVERSGGSAPPRSGGPGDGPARSRPGPRPPCRGSCPRTVQANFLNGHSRFV